MKQKIKHDETGFQTNNVVLISVSHFLHDVYTSFLAPALPIIIEKLQISYGLAGLLAVIQRVPNLLNPAMGIMADRMKMRYLVITTPAITGISMSLIGIAPSYIFLALLLLVSGISSSFFHVPTPVMVKRVSGERLGKGMSYYMLGGELARTVGPMVMYWIIVNWGIEGTYKMIPLGILASGIMFYRLRNIEVATKIESDQPKTHYFQLFLNYLPVFTVTAGITFFLGAMRSALTLYLPTFMTEQGESLFFAESSLSVLQLAGAIGTMISGTLSDKFGRTKTLLIITIICPFLMLLFLNVSGIYKILTLALMGLFIFSPTSVLLALVQDQQTKHPAFLNGTFMLLNFFISASMVTLAGFMADYIGFDQTFHIAAYFSFGAVIIVFLGRKKLDA